MGIVVKVSVIDQALAMTFVVTVIHHNDVVMSLRYHLIRLLGLLVKYLHT
jgi:hypothetical protein